MSVDFFKASSKVYGWPCHLNHQGSGYTEKLALDLALDHQLYIQFPSKELWSSCQVTREGELSIFTGGSKTSDGTDAGIFKKTTKPEKISKNGNSCAVF